MVLSDNGMESYVFPVADLNGAAKPEQSKTVNITANGTQTVTPDSGKVLSSVVINTNVPAPVVQTQEKSVTITQNGDSEVTPDAGKYLSKVNISVNVAASGGDKFASLVDRSITTLTADDFAGVTSIGDYAFYYYEGLTSVTIGESVTTIGTRAFSFCNGLTSVIIPSNITDIGERSFSNCANLTSVLIHEGLIYTNSYVFENCENLTSVTLPNTLLAIAPYTFNGCDSLTSLTIPASVQYIGSYGLDIGLSSKKATITMLPTTPPSIETNTFNRNFINQIIVPAGCGDAYKAATNWANFADYIVEATE